MAGLAAWYQSSEWLWIGGSVALVANWPFTLLAIMPTNKRLKAIGIDQAGQESRSLLLAWGKLHDVRSLLGLASTLLFAWSLAVTASASAA